MRIALVSAHADPPAAHGEEDTGGLQAHVAGLARALGARGHDVVVHTRRTAPEQPDTADLAPGVRVHRVCAGPPRPPAGDGNAPPPDTAGFAARLAADWRHAPPDIAHAHHWTSGGPALEAARETGVPLVQTFHALGADERRHCGGSGGAARERERAEAAIAHGADRVIATSAAEQRELRSWNVAHTRITVVPCAVDRELFRPEGPVAERGARPRILSLGRPVPRKGVRTVIGALAAVPGAELVVAGGAAPERIGQDPHIAALRSCAREAGVAERTVFTGGLPHPAVPALLRSADVVVSVPWYEPFGMGTLEAMACGVPVIAANVGGHLDTVVQGVTGCLVPPRDARALAYWIRTLLADPVTRDSLGIAAADRVSARYTWPLVARQCERCYDRVLRERGREVPDRAGAPAAAAPGGR